LHAVLEDTNKADLDLSISIDETTHDFSTCKYHDQANCENLDENSTIESQIAQFVGDIYKLKFHIKKILVEHQAEQHGSDKCSYFEGTIRDQRRVSAGCGTVQPISHYGELASVLTLITISVVAFAVPAGLWLVHRSFRYWQLRSLISRYKTAFNL
jgi:hypothetical protein